MKDINSIKEKNNRNGVDKLKNYCIDFCECDKYSIVVYSVSYINPFVDLNDISNKIKETSPVSGFVLFDLLLSNGDSFNRFAEAYFDGMEIKKGTISVVSLHNEKQLTQINSHFKGRFAELNNSVLSPSERLRFAKA